MLGLIAGVAIVLPLIWLLARRRKAGPLSLGNVILTRQSDGSLNVPVRGLESRGAFGSMTKNSFRPSLHILPDGLRFRIIKESCLPFAEIDKVTLAKGFLGRARLLISSRRMALDVTLDDISTARAVLLAFPASVSLSEAAISLRDRVPDVTIENARSSR